MTNETEAPTPPEPEPVEAPGETPDFAVTGDDAPDDAEPVTEPPATPPDDVVTGEE